MKKFFIIFFIIFSVTTYSQFSKTHYIPPVSSNNNMIGDHYLYISTPSTTDVNFKILSIGGAVVKGVVNKSNPFVYAIGVDNSSQMVVIKNNIGKFSNKGLIIEAEDLVYVSMRINSSLNTASGLYNHAGGLVSKGNSALGTTFRLGAMLNPLFDTSLLNFGSILATENNTKITISNIKKGTILTNGTLVNGPIIINLDKNESYVIALENQNPTIGLSNSSNIIGALIESDKPIAVNSGSFGGSNSNIVNAVGNPLGRDVGFDQIVPFEKTGTEYIFVKGLGTSELERVFLIGHKDGTKVFLNGNMSVSQTINAGEFIDINGDNFINGNLYVSTTQPVFAYQSIGGGSSPANQNMFFVPPINCTTPRIVDNIPLIQSIGKSVYTGGLNIVTEKGAIVSVNDVPLTITPVAITGNPNFERYTILSLTGNVSIKSTRQVYVSYFGTNAAATYGGYYSGFDTKPEVVLSKISTSSSSCLPNTILKTSTISAYDSFQWYFNDQEIIGATNNQFTPTTPGYYNVKGSITSCITTIPLFSDKIPVSICTTDLDNDKVNDNIDKDLDNDGVTNDTESYGNSDIDTSVSSTNVLKNKDYTNSYTSLVSTSVDATTTPFVGATNGSFITETAIGLGNFVDYKLTFNNPVSIGLQYVSTASATDLINAEAEYVVKSDVDKTITVINPSNQLLIDTNYDGVYESGITEYSSFEIRFRLNSTIPLEAGKGDFMFSSYLTKSFTLIHKNLSDKNNNKSTFKIFAIALSKDTDKDGLPDQIDPDSDNDQILDIIEAQINNALGLTNIDSNSDGIDNAFNLGLTPIDTDKDGVFDYLDLDSDNDGILDLEESGNLVDNADIDNDGIKNYRDLDSDNDLCLDVKEAGFSDPDMDGIVSTSPVTVDFSGKVVGAPYTTPDNNYKIAAPLNISQQPLAVPICEFQNSIIEVISTGDRYQWQVSTDGIIWSDLTNNTKYAGTTTNKLIITSVTTNMSRYQYRVFINRTGNSCGLISTATTLTVNQLPILVITEIKQCDEDLDGITSFNLKVKNNIISANYANETFAYYRTKAGANTADPAQLISNTDNFVNTTPFSTVVWIRVTNLNNCFEVVQLNLKVNVTQIPNTFKRVFETCDDDLDTNGNYNTANNNKRDGISSFDFSSVETEIKKLLPLGNYSVKFYKNQDDALAELNQIININNYRNIEYPNTQQIWGRVDNSSDNACYGYGPYITLNVEKLPVANNVTFLPQCDDDQDGVFEFNTSALESKLINGQSNIIATYYDSFNNPLKDANGLLITSPFPAKFTSKSQKIIAKLNNNTTLNCFDQTTIEFVVDVLPQAHNIPLSLTTKCDDEFDPLLQDGKVKFDTTGFHDTILTNQIGMSVEYIDQNNTQLPSPFPNSFNTTTQNIKVVVTNQKNNNCVAKTELAFIINPLPFVNRNTNKQEDQLICTNLTTFNTQVIAGLRAGSDPNDYSYIWKKDTKLLVGEEGSVLNVINTEGLYNVQVTNKRTGCSIDKNVKVTSSEKPIITTVDVNDFSDSNAIKVFTIGRGQYEFSLNEPQNFFQSSNVFENLLPGIYTAYVNDKKGCGMVNKQVSVIGAPKFFTPNNDGFNDYWNVGGIGTGFNTQSEIKIYNRFGILIKNLNPLEIGWDGTLNGNPLPSDDYWYTIKLEDGRESRGHFTLKR